MNLKTTLPPPAKPNNIPVNSQWLSGEGAGSWFYLEAGENNFQITRYSPEGKIECRGIFTLKQAGFNSSEAFQFVHLSHCQQVTVWQKGKVFVFQHV